MTRVAIIDQREIWSSGVGTLLQACGFELDGSWSDPEALLPAIMHDPPDILIVSVALFQQECLSELAEIDQRPRIVLVIDPGDSLTHTQFGGFDIEGLLMRDTPAWAVEACLKSVAGGHAWVDPSVFSAVGKNEQASAWECLSARELEVASLAARGLSNKRIAQTLHVSEGTVKMHIHHILTKLNVSRRSDLSLVV